jgi:hypothetical protein
MSHFTQHILDENERILLKVRKHWFLIFGDIMGVFLMVFVPILLAAVTPAGAQFLGSPMGIFLSCLWLMAGSIAIATVWTNYYLDVWIVTDKRIVNVEQLTLFSRETTTMRIERIQDATVEIHGVLPSMLGYGNLRIQSAGDAATEHKNRLTLTGNERPISE